MNNFFLKYIDLYLIPVLEGRPSLFAFDCVEFHKTPAVQAKLHNHDIFPSLIPPGCTGLGQPLDVSVNSPLKSILRDLTDSTIEWRGQELDKWTVSERRILTTHCVVEAWEEFCTSKRDIIINVFRNIGLSLPIDRSCDTKLHIKGFDSDSLSVGNWQEGACFDLVDELLLGWSIEENSILDESCDNSSCIDFVAGGTLMPGPSL